MGTFTFRLPDIGEGIAEAEIVAWHVQVGDMVAEDGRLADMMTDKATVEMESPVAGKVISVAGAVGDMVPIGAPLVVLEVEGEVEGSAGSSTSSGRADAGLEPEKPSPLHGRGLGERAPQDSAPELPPTPQPLSPEGMREKGAVPAPVSHAKVLASPAVRARAAELGIDLADVRPAEDGRIRHADLDAFVAYNAAWRVPARRGEDRQVRVIGLRRRIAENMAASKRNIPHFSYVEECDVTALEEMRAQLNAAGGDRPRLTMLPLLITAICRTLPDFPMLNARYDDEAGVVTRFGAVHLGMATQTPGGLMVPVIRDAQDRNPWQLAREIAALAQAARNGTATPQQMAGSTITLTSLGALGGVASTPVINRPEVAIIGPNRIVERPMFVADESNGFGGGERIVKRKLMNISISCDHRVVDGWDAASFVQAVKRLIEAPALLLAP